MLKMNASLRSIWTLVPGIIPAWEAGVPGRILESKPQESATGIVWHLSAICPIVGNMGGGWSSWVSAFPPSSESGFKLNSAFIWERWAGFYKVVRRNLPFSFAEKKKNQKKCENPRVSSSEDRGIREVEEGPRVRIWDTRLLINQPCHHARWCSDWTLWVYHPVVASIAGDPRGIPRLECRPRCGES